MEHLGSEVTTEHPPCGTVQTEADDVLITGCDLTGGVGGGTRREDGAVLDEGLVGERSIGDENGRTRADGKSDDGTILGMETSKDRNEFIDWITKPNRTADDRDTERARRKRRGRVRRKEKIEESSDEKGETERDEDGEPGLHDYG